jgi:DNA polymerase-3 subunit delta
VSASLADLEKALESDPWPTVVLITGEDLEVRRGAIETILSALPEDERRTAVNRFEDAPLARALDAARTPSLLGGRRVVILESPDALTGRDDAAREALLDYVRSPSACALLVIVAEKVDGRTALVKEIVKSGLRIEGARPREREMPAWIIERARARGLKLSGQVAQVIADATGNDPSLACREIDKLMLVFGDSERPDVDVVEELLRPGRAVGAFELEDAILRGRRGSAMRALGRQMAGSGAGDALGLLARLSGMARRLVVANDVLSTGGGELQVREALSCHPFVAKKYTEAARAIGRHAGSALAACVRADGMLKSGRDPRDALRSVVVAFGGGRGESSRAAGRRPGRSA